MFFPGGSDYVGIQTKGATKMNIDSMIQGNPQALVTSYNGVLVADSLEVAERFGKPHKNVLRTIDSLVTEVATQNCATNAEPEDYFILAEYQNRGKTYKKYLLTRDGFSLLVMGFTGPAALHWKLLYIEAFPSENTYDMEWNETVIERQADMADLVDAGAELPLTDRDPVRRVSGSIADMGQSYILTKKELAAMSDKGNEGRRKMAVQQVLKKTAQLKSNIDARVEWLRWQALGNGAMIYDKSGIKLGVDFGVPEANKVTAATAWGADGATILANYERWVQDYIDGNDNGYAPDVFVTGIENIRIVLNDVAIRKAITGYSDKLLTLDELNTFLRGRELPPMEAFDAKVTYRDPTNGGKRTTARLLDSKKGVFLMEGDKIGNVQMGPTYENNMEPGIFARTFTMERPLREVVEVVAAGFPKIMYPELIKICTVR